MILSFRTDTSWQTVQTQIRLLLEEQSSQGLHCLLFLEEQSDQGLHCLLFHLHVVMKNPKFMALCMNFRKITA